MKIEFREALTVKQEVGRKFPAGATILMLFTLATLVLSTPALSRSFLNPRLISAFLTLAPYRSFILRPLNLLNLTLPRFSPNPFFS